MIDTTHQGAHDFLSAQSARLLAYLRILSGPDAEDVLQEVFVRFLKEGPAPGTEAEKWLFCVARNVGLKVLRGDQRRRRREILTFSTQAGPDPRDVLAAAEEQSKMGECLDRLDNDVRELVYLKIVENQTYQELSELTGLPRSTVCWKVQDGLVQLKRLFHGN